MADVTRQESLA